MRTSLRDKVHCELEQPVTKLGRFYIKLLLCTTVTSLLIIFILREYPSVLPLGSIQLVLVEAFILLVFGTDVLLRAYSLKSRNRWEWLYLLVDIGAVLPSLMVVMMHFGWLELMEVESLALLRLFRLFRILKLLRLSKSFTRVLGASVFSSVFTTMAVYLALRVILLELEYYFPTGLLKVMNSDALALALTAVGSAFGIALAITFGIAKQKQFEITELHRLALDSLRGFEHDIRFLAKNVPQTSEQQQEGEAILESCEQWRLLLQAFLKEQLSYPAIKAETNCLLYRIRDYTLALRPSLDVPFYACLLNNMVAFLTKTQINFHPVFYQWLNHISHVYFFLLIFVMDDLAGLIAQMILIFVFKGLVVIIDDMDHAVDERAIIFNARFFQT